MSTSDLTCPKCGSTGTSRRSHSQHVRWCGHISARPQRVSVRIPSPCSQCDFVATSAGHLARHIRAGHQHPQFVPKITCPTCHRLFLTEAKLKSHQHASSLCRIERAPAHVPGASPVSVCCAASVHAGETHALGNRYCDKCGEACAWSRGGKLPQGLNKSFVCLGMKDCPRLTEYKDGYCLPCHGRRGRVPNAEEQDVLTELRSDDAPDA